MPDLMAHPNPTAAARGLTPLNVGFLQKHIYSTTGIVVDSSKDYLLETRLNPIVQEMKLKTLDDLCKLLMREPGGMASRLVIDSITTNETLFFRDIATFNALRDAVIPAARAQAAGRRLRIWSAAASSGQESYSLAMMLLEMGLQARDVEIHATDISEKILEKARDGKYVQFEVNRGLPAGLMTKYFTRAGLSWRIHDAVRAMVKFNRHDLRQTYVNGLFDLVLCRNVLIYFDAQTKGQVLQNIANTMNRGAHLVLGCAETITSAGLPLDRHVLAGTPFYCKKT